MDFFSGFYINQSLFDEKPYEYELTRNESDFLNFLNITKKLDEKEITISLSFIAKKWYEKFFNEFIKINPSLIIIRLKIINSNLKNETFENLYNNLNLSQLTELNLSSNLLITDKIIEKISLNSIFLKLKILILKNNKAISDQSLFYLSKTNNIYLEVLNVNNCSITNNGLDYFLEEPFSSLISLNLSRNNELNKLIGLKNLKKLKNLEISFCQLIDKSILGLIESNLLCNLESLDISNNTSYGPDIIVNSMMEIIILKEIYFDKLIHLNLSNLYLDPEILIKLFLNRKCFPSLKMLKLSNNNLNDKLFAIKNISNQLTYLYIDNCKLEIKNLDLKFSNLVYLNLNLNEIPENELITLLNTINDDLKYISLVKCNLSIKTLNFIVKKFKKIIFLNLRDNFNLGDDGINLIFKNNLFENLEFLNISSCNLTNESIELLGKHSEKFEGKMNLRDLRIGQNKIDSSPMNNIVKNLDKFPFLKKIAIGSFECMSEFEGKNILEEKNILFLPIIGDELD